MLATQVDEMRELSALAKDAAEILWEMVALGESGAAFADMRSKAEQLQAQLRGLISDYSGGDETLLAQAIEAFDMISRCLDSQAPEAGQPAKAGGGEPAPAAPQGAAAPAQPSADAAPLISFD